MQSICRKYDLQSTFSWLSYENSDLSEVSHFTNY